jgi:hypothetical protein
MRREGVGEVGDGEQGGERQTRRPGVTKDVDDQEHEGRGAGVTCPYIFGGP